MSILQQRQAGLLALALLLILPGAGAADETRAFELAAKETLTVVRMNRGDALQFTLKNGQPRSFVLEEASARIVERERSGIVYAFECRLIADGQPLTLRRYVCSQETFYEPWVINGVRLWFSSSGSIFKLVPMRYPEDHDNLEEDAIFALQDATLPICPQPMQPWFPIERRFIDVGACYNGDDPWMGPYLGQACHMGMDINMPKGTPLYAPIDFDTQWIFSADHRWRGVRRWDNGDHWGLQSHHVERLLIPEDSPVKAGKHYAEAAGKGVGSHQHSHFEFRVGRDVLNRGRVAGTEIDPWILFWQIFETHKLAEGAVHAAIDSVAPGETGQPIAFSATGSRPTKGAGPLRHFWAFGDGGWSHEASPRHAFTQPGVYPVTLVVDDGQQRATHTQHVTINGPRVQSGGPLLTAPDEFSFRPRPVHAADVYGWPVMQIPHTVHFTALPNGPMPPSKYLTLSTADSSTRTPDVTYHGEARDWLQVAWQGEGARQRLELSANPAALPAGRYEAIVTVRFPAGLNPVQGFRVALNVRPTPDAKQVVVDDRDENFFATPFAWVGHQLIRAARKGHANRYLTNGGVPDADAIARFTPDLSAGRYEVRFHPETPSANATFKVRIRHAGGEEVKTIRTTATGPEPSTLGTFDFAEGADGFVEISAKDSQGHIVADAIVFERR